MKFTSPIRLALAAIALTLLTSCGGGGAKTDSNLGGVLQVLPSGTIFYAGVVYTMTVAGGSAPYTLTSDNPSILPVPSHLSGHSFDVVGANPFVVDPGLPANALPVKTVVISARDTAGNVATASIQVGRNFLTGYTLDFTTTTCTGINGAPVLNVVPCAGGDTTAEVDATINGNFVGDAKYTLEVVSGTMGFVNPLGSNTVTPTYTATSDHQGKIIAVVRVPVGTPTQIGIIRVTHVDSGVSTEYAFTITGAAVGPLAAVPPSISFTGADATSCGFGSSDFFVTGGTPPYSATSTSPRITVTVKDAAKGQFTVNVGPSAPPCATGSIIVQDSANSTPVNVPVTSTAGSAALAQPLQVSPNTTGTIKCGTSASVIATGGTGGGKYFAASSSSTVDVVVAGSVVTITPQAGQTTAQTVTVTDGSTTVPVAVPVCTP